MTDTIGKQLKDARETLCSSVNARIMSFEKDTGVTVEALNFSLDEVKSGGGALEAKTETKRHIHVRLNL